MQQNHLLTRYRSLKTSAAQWHWHWQGSHPPSFFFFLPESFKSMWDFWQQDVSHPLQYGDVWEAGGALEPWESVAGALPSFFGGSLGRTLAADITSSTAAGLATRASGGLHGDEPDAHFLGVMQG